jgi:hypothetical protein
MLIASVLPSQANWTIHTGTTTRTSWTVNFLNSTNTTRVLRDSSNERYLGGYSSLGDPGYFVFLLNTKAKTALKIVDETADGPRIFPNFNGTSLGYELHKQFNKKWWEDIPALGDTTDIRNWKIGDLNGARRLVPLREAGFDIEVAPKLSGTHFHTRCSWDFGIDSSVAAGYSAGYFYQSNLIKSTGKIHLKLSDQANLLGGTFLAALGVAEDSLEDDGFTIVTAP